jgi:hypothetical protein
MVRYAAALALVKEWTASAGLTLHPTKTRLVDERKDGYEFLGYHFEAGKRWPRSKSLKKFRDTIPAKDQANLRMQHVLDHRGREPDAAGLSTSKTFRVTGTIR